MPQIDQLSDDAILRELEELLCDVAAGRPANRAESSAYSIARTHLIASPVRPVLPGFLYQCGSLLRFKEFITLYHPDIDERQQFVCKLLDRCHAMFAARRREDAPRPDALQPHHWMS